MDDIYINNNILYTHHETWCNVSSIQVWPPGGVYIQPKVEAIGISGWKNFKIFGSFFAIYEALPLAMAYHSNGTYILEHTLYKFTKHQSQYYHRTHVTLKSYIHFNTILCPYNPVDKNSSNGVCLCNSLYIPMNSILTSQWIQY